MNIKKITPVLVDYIWGGGDLPKKWNKNTQSDTVGESWELSFHEQHECEIEGEKISVATKGLLGENAENFKIFPLLTKFITAKDNLSIQVHPSDEYSLKHENQLGKTEMWYILDVEEGAGIYLGFKKEISQMQLEIAINDGSICDMLHFQEVKKGELYFIPSGTVHAIGKGVTLFEVQQNSNVTYRISDWGRLDKNGNPRELHVEKALDVISKEPYNLDNEIKQISSCKYHVAGCEYFDTYLYKVKGELFETVGKESFHAITIVEGKGDLQDVDFEKGDTLFVPAGYGEYHIQGECEYIATLVPGANRN